MKKIAIKKSDFTRFFFTLFLFSVLIFGLVFVHPVHAVTPTVSVYPSTVTAIAGQNFSIDIRIANVLDLYGWEFKLGWNFTLLDVVNVTEGPFLNGGGTRNTFFANKTNNTEGYMLVDCTLLGSVPGVSGNGKLATVEFYVEVQGESILDLYETILINSLEQPITHTANDGTVIATIISASDCDVNGDGIVDMMDVALVCYASFTTPGHPKWDPRCDIDQNGVIDMMDIAIVCYHFLEHV